MQRYEAYKDSGIEWIGEIPAGWELLRMKRIGSFAKGAGIKKDEVLPEGMPCVRYGELYTTYEHCIADPASFVSDDLFSRSARLHDGEVVFALTGENEEDIGRCVVNLSGEALAVGGDMLAFTGHRQDGRFIAYSCNSKYFNVQRTLFARGGIIVHLPAGAVINATIVLPPLPEQQAIADYLDAKTAQIDSIVSQTERSIELLREYRKSVISEAVTKGLDPDAPMKDSGVEWIGEIPAGWTSGKLLRFASLESGHTPSKSHPEWWIESQCTIPWITTADVHRFRDGGVIAISDTVEHISQVGMDNSSARLLPAGTVALSRTASVGFSVVLSEPMASSQDFADWIPGDQLTSEYLLFCFRAMGPVFDKLMIGSTHKTIYMPDIRRLAIPVPPLPEQQAIADYLDEKTAKIDSLIADKQRQVELLKEYRKSLISEAVTGKFKVPGLE